MKVWLKYIPKDVRTDLINNTAEVDVDFEKVLAPYLTDKKKRTEVYVTIGNKIYKSPKGKIIYQSKKRAYNAIKESLKNIFAWSYYNKLNELYGTEKCNVIISNKNQISEIIDKLIEEGTIKFNEVEVYF